MNVLLTPELEELIKDKVRSGRYASSSEVVREALRLLEARDRNDADMNKARKLSPMLPVKSVIYVPGCSTPPRIRVR